MPIKIKKNRVDLVGEVAVDDAESLFAWLVSHPRAQVDASQATHLHTAVLQAIAANARQVSGLPSDPFLADCISQLTMLQADQRT